MKVKKLFVTTLSLIMMFNLLSISILAETENNIEELKTKYNLKTVKEVPANVTPLKFETIEQANEYLESVKEITKDKKITKGEFSNINTLAYNISSRSSSSNNSGSFKYAKMHGVGCYLNVIVDYTYGYNSSLDKNVFASASVNRTYLGGLTYGFKWEEFTSERRANVIDGGRTIEFGVKGLITQYIVIPGATDIATWEENINEEQYYSIIN